jgi:RNA-binding protein Musashi
MQSCQIDPKRAIPRDEQERTSKIFVGGVSQEATEQDFKNFFMQFGRVLDATLMMDKDTGRPRGFGFVTFDSEAAVDRTLERPLEILGKFIEVKKAQPRGNIRDDEDGRGGRFNKHKQNNFNGGGAAQGGGFDGGMGGQNGQAMGGNNGMSPAMMAQYWQRMQQYFSMMQQQMAGGGAMNPMMGGGQPNPAMMQQMMAMQQGGMGRGQGTYITKFSVMPLILTHLQRACLKA